MTPHLTAYFERIGVGPLEGQIAEINLQAQEWMALAASTLRRGYLVIVDYGAEATELYHAAHRQQGTLRAFHHHQFAHDPLAHPGQQDLTTTIDWTSLIQTGEENGLHRVTFERQDKFLLRVGLLDQLETMTAGMSNGAEALALRSTARDLILPGGMSQSFQVLVQKRQR